MHNMARYRHHDTFFACSVPRRLTKEGKRHEKVDMSGACLRAAEPACLRCNNAIRTIWGGTSYKLSDSACPHTLYMIQDPYEDQLVPANDYTHLQGQAHTSLCADATEARRIKGWC